MIYIFKVWGVVENFQCEPQKISVLSMFPFEFSMCITTHMRTQTSAVGI